MLPNVTEWLMLPMWPNDLNYMNMTKYLVLKEHDWIRYITRMSLNNYHKMNVTVTMTYT